MRREEFPSSRENVHQIIDSCFTTEGEQTKTATNLSGQERRVLRGWLQSFNSSNVNETPRSKLRGICSYFVAV